ncbi:MAG: glycerol-3-phosphate 1-O-acyltransferase PlsY [Acutalibacter sp.]|jgi:glycerol-3-phosphate acyltransferase PlsY
MAYEVLALALTALAGYLLGSINSSIIFTWFFKDKEDIRSFGSGNAGMTNVLRSVGKLPAALTFVGDFLKCVAALLLAQGFVALFTSMGGIQAQELYDVAKYVAGVACVLGHIFPVYYGFRGGKGVVTSAAMIALTDWRVFLLVLLTFIIVFAAKRIVSLASIICAALYPVFTFLFLFLVEFAGSPLPQHGNHSLAYLLFATAASLFIGLTVIVKHRANIGRLLRGEEKPIILKKEK